MKVDISSNIDLKLKRNFLDFFKKRLIINSKDLIYGEKSISCSDVKEIRYGITQLYINGIKANRIYEIGIKTSEPKPIRITFQSLKLFYTNKKLEDIYYQITSSIWKNITSRLIDESIQSLEKGKSFNLEKIDVEPKGIRMRTRRWYGKKETFFVEWKDLRKYTQDGKLCIYSEENKNAKLKLNFQRDWNTVVLASLLDYLWEDGRALLLR